MYNDNNKMTNECYFDEIDSELKAYVLGFVVFNIKKAAAEELVIQLNTTSFLSEDIEKELRQITTDISESEKDMFVISSPIIIQDIYRHTSQLNKYYSVDIAEFIKNNKHEHVVEFLKAYFEKHATLNSTGIGHICHITDYSKSNLEAFASFFNIPYATSNIFNLVQISYTNVNIIDLLGIIYKNHRLRIKDDIYIGFLKLLNCIRPVLKYMKISEDAVIPTKANFSDVGYDLSIIGVHSDLSRKTEILRTGTSYQVPITTLYKTGIKLEIPLGYYVEIVPRSSLSKSGYMLANSIGIIDCSYKGELLVALAKINEDASDIKFPFRCCQLIMRKQIYPEMMEVQELECTKRLEGGFGSSKEKCLINFVNIP